MESYLVASEEVGSSITLSNGGGSKLVGIEVRELVLHLAENLLFTFSLNSRQVV